MIEVITSQKEVKVLREFAGIEAYEEGFRLRLSFREKTTLDGEVIKEEIKTYDRDYLFWKASPLGQSILGMVNLDLAQLDPSAPRITPTE